MHKQVKNDKVLRAITIGIAAMMATASMPATVLANENSEGSEPSQAPETSQTSENQSSETSASESASENTVSEPVAQIQSEAASLPADSAAASGLIADAMQVAQANGDEVIIQDLTLAQQALTGTEDTAGATAQLEAAADLLDDAEGIEEKADVFVSTADGLADNVNDSLEDYDTADKETRKAAAATVSYSETANTTDSKKEAYDAKDRAEENLKLVEQGFKEANDAFFDAQAKADAAESAYDAAEAEHQAALAKVEEAKAKLMEAQANTIAASEQLKAAQDRAASLEREMVKLEQSSEQLEAIRGQYYALMVEYYRSVLGGGGAVYNEKGELDIEACAQKVTQKQLDDRKGESARVMKLGRDLLKKLVEYQLMTDDIKDYSFAEKEEGNKKQNAVEAREGIVFESSEYVKDEKGRIRKEEDESNVGKDQVVVDQENGRKDDSGKTIMPNDAYDLYQEKSDQKDNGKTNRFKLTYTDQDGVEQTIYYNYVFKTDVNTEDLTTGPIYLAEIKQDDNGKWYTEKVLGESNFSDYKNLLAAMDSLAKSKLEYEQKKESWEAAKVDVEKAKEKVDQLTEDIEALENVKADSSKVDALRAKLDEANQELAKATEKKVTLQQEVQAAEDAYESIDLSRFNLKPAPVDEDDDSAPSGGGSTVTAPGAAEVAPAAAAIPVIPTAAGGFAQAGGQTGTQAGGMSIADFTDFDGAGAGEDEEIATPSPIEEAMEVAAETKEAGTQEVVNLEEEELAGAASADVADKAGMNLWWLLVVALFGATGKAMYERHKEKVRAKEDHPEM